MVEKIFTWFGNSSVKRPLLVISIILAISAFFAVGVFRIHQGYGFGTFLSDSSDVVRTMNEAEEKFGGIDEERVLVETANGFDGALLRKVTGYRSFLEGEPGIWGDFVVEVNTPLDSMVYMDGSSDGASPGLGLSSGDAAVSPAAGEPLMSVIDSLSDEEILQQVELNLRAQEEQMQELGATSEPQNISADGHAILIKTTMRPGLTSSGQIDLVGRFSDKTREYFEVVPGTEVFVAGNASMQKESSESTLADTKLLFALVFLFIVLVLFLTFRRVTDVIFTLLVILLTIVWVMGFQGWVGFPFSYSNAAIMPLLLGIDIAYAIHVLTRYYEERVKGEDPSASALRSVVTVGVAVFLTAATTAFGFASFGISNMPIIQQFGMVCVVGVMVSFVLAVTLLPAVLVLRDRRERAQKKWRERQHRKDERNRWSPVDSLLARVAVITEHHRVVVAAISLLIIVGSIALGFTLKTEADVFKLLPDDLPFKVATQKINDYFGGQEMVYTLVRGDVLEPSNLEAILAYEEALALVDHVGDDGEDILQRGKIYSIADVVKNFHGSVPASKAEVMAVLYEVQQAGPSGQSASDNQLITEDLETALVSIRVNRGSQEDMRILYESIQEATAQTVAAAPGVTMGSSGLPLLFHEMLGTIVPTQVKTTAVALILCALIVILVFRSISFGLAASSVVFISVAMELGALALLGWPLDFMTVMVSSLVIGAGIDFGIHVTHRFMEEWRDGGVEIDEAIRRTVGSVGKALIAAAVTTTGAFLILAFSKLGFLQRFGVITALSLTFALLASLLILPSILAWRAQRLEKKTLRN
ncbi:MAG: MMPL family transporter [Actinomycetota bacterium]